ncbi:hypothetical protein IWX49DRAFT_77640 [Phyllosticta citricarpa]
MIPRLGNPPLDTRVTYNHRRQSVAGDLHPSSSGHLCLLLLLFLFFFFFSPLLLVCGRLSSLKPTVLQHLKLDPPPPCSSLAPRQPWVPKCKCALEIRQPDYHTPEALFSTDSLKPIPSPVQSQSYFYIPAFRQSTAENPSSFSRQLRHAGCHDTILTPKRLYQLPHWVQFCHHAAAVSRVSIASTKSQLHQTVERGWLCTG